MQNPEVIEGLAINFDNDKFTLPITMPLIENRIKHSNHMGTVLYRNKILKEIELFKEAIGYDSIRAEIDADMEMLRKFGWEGSRKIDERLGIVRDQYGREVSRNGVPNPYYYTVEEMEEMNREYDEAMKTPETAEEWFNKITAKVNEEIQEEYNVAKSIADSRLEEIYDNPTINYYELGR